MFLFSRQVEAQTRSEADQNSGTYSLRLSVDEVVLTFHATDTHGLPVNDLKLDEFRLLDDGATPRRIVSSDSLIDRPIRAGILLDTSESLERALPGNKLIAERYAQRLFRQKPDQAIVMDFGYPSGIAQSWTSDPLLLSQKHDGAFCQIELQPPDRVSKIEVRSGYYAPVR
jgi:hypothetical protein